MNQLMTVSSRSSRFQSGLSYLIRRIYCVLMLSLAFGSLPGRASPPPAGVAPVITPAGGFSIDGDVIANSPIANLGDWVATTNAGSGTGVLTLAGVPINTNTTFHFSDPYGNSG